MIKRIIDKIMQKKKTENNGIIWPSSWDYDAVERFNIMLMGMALEKQP